MSVLSEQESTVLEEIIDKHGLTAVLSALSGVCYTKAEHVESNWQDGTIARHWERTARAIDRFSRHAAVTASPLP